MLGIKQKIKRVKIKLKTDININLNIITSEGILRLYGAKKGQMFELLPQDWASLKTHSEAAQLFEEVR